MITMYLLASVGGVFFSFGLFLAIKEMWLFHRVKTLNSEQKKANITQLLYKVGLARGILIDKYAITKTGSRWDGFKSFTVIGKVKESDGVYSFLLQPNDQKILASFFPGQHVMVQADIEGQCQTISRAYSLSDSPEKLEHYRITVKKQLAPSRKPDVPSGIMSTYLVDQVEVGQQLKLSAPSGHFCLNVNQHHPLVLIAGGIGITPFISMINAVINANSERTIWLFYSTQTPHTRVMFEHLQHSCKRYKNLHVVMCYSAATSKWLDENEQQPTDSRLSSHSGRITLALLKQYLPSNEGEFFVCGTKQMMAQMQENLLLWQVNQENIHFEVVHLTAGTLRKTIQTSVTTENSIICCARSGKSLKWHDSDEGTSILSLAEFNGIFIRNSCRSGECGMCRTKIKSGEVLHLVANEETMKVKGTCLPCVAVPNSQEVTLDI